MRTQRYPDIMVIKNLFHRKNRFCEVTREEKAHLGSWIAIAIHFTNITAHTDRLFIHAG